ncbi:MAG: DMT family transporter [Pyrinomonadaceae bacterium]
MKILVWVILCLVWGSTWLVIKIGLRDIPPLTFASYRFILSIFTISIVLKSLRIPFPDLRREWKFFAFTGILQFTINYAIVFWSELYITSGLAAVLQATIPLFGLLLATFYLPDERITKLKLGALLIGFVGVGVIFSEQLRINDLWAFAGSIAIVFGAFIAALASIQTKAKGSHLNPAALLLGQMIFGGVPLMFLAFVFEGNPLRHNFTQASILSIIYLSWIGTVVAFWLYYWLLKRVESTKAMTISLVTPLTAVVFGAIFLHEKLPKQTAFGGILILLSVALIIFRRRIRTL